MGARLPASFFALPCHELAEALLGQVLCRRVPSGSDNDSGEPPTKRTKRCSDVIMKVKITEVEAYPGNTDVASHSSLGKRTKRNEAMFMPAGTAYVYRIYGMYNCINISSQEEGGAVLIRAGEPLQGIDAMRRFRRSGETLQLKNLCNGPSKLCQALAIETSSHDKEDLPTSADVWLEAGDGSKIPSANVMRSTRIGIEGAGKLAASLLWRYYVLGTPFISKRDVQREKQRTASQAVVVDSLSESQALASSAVLSALRAQYESLEKGKLWAKVFDELQDETSEYENLYPSNCARAPSNRHKNRYVDVLPYDHNRVKLQGEADYINASVARVAPNRVYILAQGPVESAIDDFWQMIWQYRCPAVVMLNNTVEHGRVKCAQYWPADERNCVDTEAFSLRFTTVLRRCAAYQISQIEVKEKRSGNVRLVSHCHYTSWPDFGVPASNEAFLEFYRAVRTSGYLDDPACPTVIHCSAGIGRSGTFVMVDSALVALSKGEQQLDVVARVAELRRQRNGIVQSPEQLRFTYRAIINAVPLI